MFQVAKICVKSALFIALALFGAAPAQASICNLIYRDAREAIRDGMELDPDWKAFFYHLPADVPVNTEYTDLYVKYATEAIFNDFEPWLEGRNALSYLELLREMRRTAIFGTASRQKWPELNTLSGKDLENFLMSGGREIEPYRGFFKGNTANLGAVSDDSLRTKALEMWIQNNEVNSLKEALGDLMPVLQASPEMVLKIDGISPENLPRNLKRQRQIIHQYPSHLEEYVAAAGAQLLRIRASWQRLTGTELVTAVARYYYIATQAHFFNRINNSILMAQVNAMLLKKGFNGIQHRHLDYAVLLTDLESFTVIFQSVVADAQ